MTPDQAKRMQARLGVAQDGQIGRATLTALFARMGCPSPRAAEYGLAANVHFRTYLILETPLRLAHFMAQLAHESGGFRYMEEIWGPTEAQKRYEGRDDLGNTHPGDGLLFKGRGPMQLTGRANYRVFGQQLGIDFESHPELPAIPSIGLLVACTYWAGRGLNAFADADDILTITKRINGGTNGLGDRQNRYTTAKGLIL